MTNMILVHFQLLVTSHLGIWLVKISPLLEVYLESMNHLSHQSVYQILHSPSIRNLLPHGFVPMSWVSLSLCPLNHVQNSRTHIQILPQLAFFSYIHILILQFCEIISYNHICLFVCLICTWNTETFLLSFFSSGGQFPINLNLESPISLLFQSGILSLATPIISTLYSSLMYKKTVLSAIQLRYRLLLIYLIVSLLPKDS